MTSLAELKELQSNARRAGRVANLCFNEQNEITGVAYLDAKGPGRQRAGMILSPLSFAETERAKPKWWEKQRIRTLSMLPYDQRTKELARLWRLYGRD